MVQFIISCADISDFQGILSVALQIHQRQKVETKNKRKKHRGATASLASAVLQFQESP
jgi:hypothetical protein